MYKNPDNALEKEIKSIYKSFLECTSDKDQSSGLQDASCYEKVLAKLLIFREKHNNIYESKIETLTELIKTKIQYLNSSSQSENKELELQGRLNQLGVRYVKKPARNFKDILGLEEVKKVLRTNVIYPLQFKELSKEFGIKTNGGILLYGPPGNGKTYLAESVAGEAGIGFLELNPAFLYNEYFGKFEKNISEIFDLARKTAPNILFFDEVESLIPRRENADHSVVKRGVTQLLIEINKLISDVDSQTFLIAATNLPWEIDPAMLRPGRFDLKIYISLPNRDDREALVNNLLQSTTFSNQINACEIAELTEGFSVSDIYFIMRQAAENVFYEAVSSGVKRKITKEDIMVCISRIKPSSNLELIERYKHFIS